MARPIKNSCDYFSHDADMRNHKKVNAIRNKFPNGYAIWAMILEYLTGNDGNVFEYSDDEFEDIAGDFRFPVEEIRGVVDYAIQREMLFNVNGFVHSESLDARLAPVYKKRGKSKGLSEKQSRVNGKFVANNADGTGLLVAETPQIKVNNIKSNDISIPIQGIGDHQPKDANGYENFSIDKDDPGKLTDITKPEKEYLLRVPNTTDKMEVFQFIKDHQPTIIEPYVDYWNIFASTHGMAMVKKITPTRRKKLKVRLREKNFNFTGILRRASMADDFLFQSNWFGFDWILENESNYLKVLEGNYDKKKKIDTTKPIPIPGGGNSVSEQRAINILNQSETKTSHGSHELEQG